MLWSNCIKYVLHDEGAKILGDEIENEIVAQLLGVGVVGVVEGGRDLTLLNDSLGTIVDGVDTEIVEEDGSETVE